ncbi:aldo/keto reductase [Novosphingobium sp. KA1]|uniref:aldo/keto reductase n=1 Tax=Novosphingobium sp. (strain KA1) TaxID=164608 RepID=UPI001AF0A0EC|nr:aldo/keto reductase [Novosphingobium sp. KA1]QSR17141.1 aldo/keto reductase [Novosphingobium sp. KA1]
MTATTLDTPPVTRPLGTTGMEISRVGFGAWAIGGADWAVGWGTQDDADSVRAIRHAVARGVNWIDTAAIYGLGHSEEVVARALAEMPEAERPYVFTKCGQVWDPADRQSKRRVGRRQSIMDECEASLRRLRVERIDLLQMHWPAEDGTALEEYWGALLDLKAAGKVRAVGLSNHDADQLEAAAAMGRVDTLQPPLSALKRAAIARELPWCLAHDTAVIVYSPMQSGLLSGAFSAARVAGLAADDWRSRHDDFTGEALTRNLAVAAAMKPVAARHGVSPAAVAVAWVLVVPGVTGAIVGARSPAQVDGWVAGANLVLSDEDRAGIAAAIRETGAGSGPVPD